MKSLKLVDGRWVIKNVPQIRNIPNTGWSIVKVNSVGICGSDLQKFMDTKYITDITLGHEISGIVTKTSSKFKNLINAKVVVSPLIPCNKCENCEKGNSELCKHLKGIGRNIDGGFSEYVLVPSKNLYRLPDKLTFNLATLIDSLAVCIHGLKLVDVKNLKNVLIIGDGTIGLNLALLLRILYPHLKIKVMGKHQNKLSILKQFNIKIGTITDHKLEKDLYDLVVESVGRKQSETLQESIDLVKPKGTILVFGVYAQGYVSKIEIRALFYKEVTLIGSNSYTSSEKQDDFLEAINFLSKNTAVFEKIISKIISLQELPEYIFKLKMGGPNNSIKTIVEI